MRLYSRLDELVGEAPADDGELAALAERTLIPLGVLRRLRDGVAVQFDAARLRYAGGEEAVRTRPIGSARDADRLARFDQRIYPTESPLAREIYLEAARLLPELNGMYEDADGGAAGHLSCLPLRGEAYAALRDGRIHEGELGVGDLCSFAESGRVYLCSMYAAHTGAGWAMSSGLRRFVDGLGDGQVFGALAVTADGLAACRRLGMEPVREDEEEARRTRTEIVPVFLERRGNTGE